MVHYVEQTNLFQPGLAAFSEWLNDITDVQVEWISSSNPIADRTMSSYIHMQCYKLSACNILAVNTSSEKSETNKTEDFSLLYSPNPDEEFEEAEEASLLEVYESAKLIIDNYGK